MSLSFAGPGEPLDKALSKDTMPMPGERSPHPMQRSTKSPSCIGQIHDIVIAMQEANDLSARLTILTNALVEQYGYRSAGVFGLKATGRRPVLLASTNLSQEEHESTTWWASSRLRHLSRMASKQMQDQWIDQMHLMDGRDDAVLLPLRGSDGMIGCLALFCNHALERTEKERDLLTLTTIATSLFLENARYYKQVQSSHSVRLKQSRTIAASRQRLTEGLSTEEVCNSVLSMMRKVIPSRAGFMLLHHSEENVLRMTAYQGIGKESISSDDMPSDKGIAGSVFQSGRGVILPEVKQEETHLYSSDAGELRLHVMLAVPLTVQSQTIGVAGLFIRDLPEETSERQSLLETAYVFAGQAAAAIQNAYLFNELEKAYQRERHIAETFQEALIADVPDNISGLEVGHVYRAAMDEAVVGGDFYDVFPLSSKRVLLAIGDVSGKGLTAALQTARVKFGVRAFACASTHIERVIKQMHHSLIQQAGYEGFVTLFLAILNLEKGELEYANAGHESPLLYRSNGTHEWLGRTGMVLGLDLPNSMEFGSTQVQIGPGDQLVLYTDGLTEARRNQQFLGTQGLLKIWKKLAHLHPAESAPKLLEKVQLYTQADLRDDCAALIVRITKTEVGA